MLLMSNIDSQILRIISLFQLKQFVVVIKVKVMPGQMTKDASHLCPLIQISLFTCPYITRLLALITEFSHCPFLVIWIVA